MILLCLSHLNKKIAEDYFYFLNGHNDVVYFADQNFTPDLVESYEYNPWGVLLTSANKNTLLYTAREFDLDTGLFFNLGFEYNAYLGQIIKMHSLNSLFKSITLHNNPVNYNVYALSPGSDISCRRCYLVCVCCDWGACKIVWCWIFIYIHCQF